MEVDKPDPLLTNTSDIGKGKNNDHVRRTDGVRNKKKNILCEPFPWYDEFKEMCSCPENTDSIKGLVRLIKVYIGYISRDATSCRKKPSRACKIKQNLSRVLVFFHLRFTKLNLILEEPEYMELISELLTMYIQIGVKASRRGKESARIIAKKTTSILFILLRNSADYIIDTILNAQYVFKPRFKEQFIPLFMKIIHLPACTGLTYIRFLFIYKIWKFLVPNNEERTRLNKLAVATLRPTPHLMDLIERGKFYNILPNLPSVKNSSQMTRFYMITKFNLRNSIKEFLKLTKWLKTYHLRPSLEALELYPEESIRLNTSVINVDEENAPEKENWNSNSENIMNFPHQDMQLIGCEAMPRPLPPNSDVVVCIDLTASVQQNSSAPNINETDYKVPDPVDNNRKIGCRKINKKKKSKKVNHESFLQDTAEFLKSLNLDDFKKNTVDTSNEFSNTVDTSNEFSNTVDKSNEFSNIVDTSNEFSNTVDKSNEFSNTVDTSNEFSNTVDKSNEFSNTVDTSNEFSNTVDKSNEFSNTVDTSNEFSNIVDTSNEFSNTVDKSNEFSNIVDTSNEFSNNYSLSEEPENNKSVPPNALLENSQILNLNEKDPIKPIFLEDRNSNIINETSIIKPPSDKSTNIITCKTLTDINSELEENMKKLKFNEPEKDKRHYTSDVLNHQNNENQNESPLLARDIPTVGLCIESQDSIIQCDNISSRCIDSVGKVDGYTSSYNEWERNSAVTNVNISSHQDIFKDNAVVSNSLTEYGRHTEMPSVSPGKVSVIDNYRLLQRSVSNLNTRIDNDQVNSDNQNQFKQHLYERSINEKIIQENNFEISSAQVSMINENIIVSEYPVVNAIECESEESNLVIDEDVDPVKDEIGAKPSQQDLTVYNSSFGSITSGRAELDYTGVSEDYTVSERTLGNNSTVQAIVRSRYKAVNETNNEAYGSGRVYPKNNSNLTEVSGKESEDGNQNLFIPTVSTNSLSNSGVYSYQLVGNNSNYNCTVSSQHDQIISDNVILVKETNVPQQYLSATMIAESSNSKESTNHHSTAMEAVGSRDMMMDHISTSRAPQLAVGSNYSKPSSPIALYTNEQYQPNETVPDIIVTQCGYEFDFMVAHVVEVSSDCVVGTGEVNPTSDQSVDHTAARTPTPTAVPSPSPTSQAADQYLINESSELQQVLIDKARSSTNIENKMLHRRTVQNDYHMCDSQNQFKEFYLNQKVAPTIPVPLPIQGMPEGYDRCLCELCLNNHKKLVHNYSVLKNMRTSKLSCIEKTKSKILSPDKHQSPDLHCNLPFKKRKTKIPSKQEQSLHSYPNIPMMSIAQLQLPHTMTSSGQMDWDKVNSCTDDPINLVQSKQISSSKQTKQIKRKTGKRRKSSRQVWYLLMIPEP